MAQNSAEKNYKNYIIGAVAITSLSLLAYVVYSSTRKNKKKDKLKYNVIFNQKPFDIHLSMESMNGLNAIVVADNQNLKAGLKYGSRLIKINNKKVVGLTFEEILNIIQKTKCPIKLRFRQQNILKEHCINAEQLRNAAEKAFKEGNISKGIASITHAIIIHPTNKIFYANRIPMFIKCKQYEKALKDCKNIQKLDPLSSYIEGHYLRGLVLLALNKYKNASYAFETVIKLNSSYKKAANRLKECLKCLEIKNKQHTQQILIKINNINEQQPKSIPIEPVKNVEKKVEKIAKKVEENEEKITKKVGKKEEKITNNVEKKEEKMTKKVGKIEEKITKKVEKKVAKITKKVEEKEEKITKIKNESDDKLKKKEESNVELNINEQNNNIQTIKKEIIINNKRKYKIVFGYSLSEDKLLIPDNIIFTIFKYYKNIYEISQINFKNIPKRTKNDLICSNNSNLIYIFTSIKWENYYDNLFIFNIDNITTKQITFPWDEICGRQRRDHATINYHKKTHSLYLFGGDWGHWGCSQLYRFDLNENKWNYMDYKNKNKNMPKIYAHTGITYREYLIYFGGYGENFGNHYNDILIYNIDKNEFELIECFNKPSKRFRHSMVLCNDEIIIYGGFECYGTDKCWMINVNDLLNRNKPSWHKYEMNVGQLSMHKMSCFNNNIFIFGGSGGNCQKSNDLILFDNEKNKKQIIKLSGIKERVEHEMFVVTLNKYKSNFLLICGGDNGGLLNDFFLINLD
eukprot:487673_1